MSLCLGAVEIRGGFFMCLTPVIRNYCFFGFFPLTPLIVATAPLSLPYILLCKTQGRSVNTFDNRNREVCVFLLLFVASAIGEVARSAGGEVREKIYVVISVRCSIRTEYRAYIRYGFSTLAGRGCWFGCRDVLPSREEILHR